MFFDEWAYHFRPDLKGCLAIARTFHEFFRHSDFIEMAGFTMATDWLNFDRTHSVISAYGRVFQLYNRHFGKIPVAVTGNSPVPPPKYPIGGDQPRVNTGSDTWPLDVSAALTADRKALIVAVVNATEEAPPAPPGRGGIPERLEGALLEAGCSGSRCAEQRRQAASGPHPTSQLRSGGAEHHGAPTSIALYEFAAA